MSETRMTWWEIVREFDAFLVLGAGIGFACLLQWLFGYPR